uniref:Uncharacterized protein n=1 Tax=Leersia perrieri TaxID=77586 RepID=A0A0D9VKE6_9ORYZ
MSADREGPKAFYNQGYSIWVPLTSTKRFPLRGTRFPANAGSRQRWRFSSDMVVYGHDPRRTSAPDCKGLYNRVTRIGALVHHIERFPPRQTYTTVCRGVRIPRGIQVLCQKRQEKAGQKREKRERAPSGTGRDASRLLAAGSPPSSRPRAVGSPSSSRLLTSSSPSSSRPRTAGSPSQSEQRGEGERHLVVLLPPATNFLSIVDWSEYVNISLDHIQAAEGVANMGRVDEDSMAA